MAVENGQPVEATYTNSRLVSKTSLTTQTVAGPIDQTNTTDATSQTSGALKTAGGLGVALAAWIGGLFRVTNTTASTSTTSGAAVITGGVGIGGALNVGSNINAGGDIQSTGTMSGSNLSGTNTGDVTLGSVGSSPNGNGASLSGQVLTLQPANGSNPGVMTAGTQVIGGNKNFTGDVEIDGDVIVDGDFTVNGTLTTVNSATLDVTDANVTVNKGGNDTTAEGAGLTIERAGTDGSLVYQDSLASKFKAGALGSESEIMTVGTAQTVSGIKTFNADAIFQEAMRAENEINSTSTGSNVTLAPTKTVHVVTNASLVSVREVSLQNNQVMVLINRTGAAITIVDDTAGNFTSGILTGTGADLTLDDDASLLLARVEYSGPSHRIHVIGGSGGGGSPVFSPESANTVLAGPTTGSPAVPTFRALVSNDLPVIPIAKGGTGQTAKTAAFDALSPMTTSQDMILGTTGGSGARFAVGLNGATLRVNGSGIIQWGSYSPTSFSTTGTITSGRDRVLLSGTGTYTVTLPLANSYAPGHRLILIKTSSTLNTITIARNGSDLIDLGTSSVSSVSAVTPAEQWEFITDGISNWNVVSHVTNTPWIAFTPTLNSLTGVSSRNGYWRRVGDSAEVRVQVIYNGTGAASQFSADLPSGMIIDSGKTQVNSTISLGHAQWFDNGVGWYAMMVNPASTTSLVLNQTGAGVFFNTSSTANLDTLSLFTTLPISGWFN